jgi:hypothetical protein
MAIEQNIGGEGDRGGQPERITIPLPLAGPSIVLRGRFNAAIFQPAWMAANKLIRDEEATAAKSFVAFENFLTFRTEWFRLQVTDDRFDVAGLKGGHEAPLRDLVLGIFALLEHTPLGQMGLNYHTHERLDRDEDWARIERRLFDSSPLDTVLPASRLTSATFSGNHADAPRARIQVKVEPSAQIRPGLYVSTNEHYEESGPDSGHRLMQTLKERWEGALIHAQNVASHIHSLRHEVRA